MAENRDFLAEFEQLRVETDGIRDALVSRTGHFQNLLSSSGVLKEIMGELKAIRKEIKEGKEENEKKLKELRNEISKLSGKVDIPKIPIRQEVLGEWKMVGEERTGDEWPFGTYDENLKFELVDGRLKQSGGGLDYMFEEEHGGVQKLFVEDDHLKTIWVDSSEEVYIANGQLHFVKLLDNMGRVSTWLRRYEKI